MKTLYIVNEGAIEILANCFTGQEVLQDKLVKYYESNNNSILVLAMDAGAALELCQKYDNDDITVDNIMYNNITVACLS